VEPGDDWLAEEGELDWLHDPRGDGSVPAAVERSPERRPPPPAAPRRDTAKAITRRRRAFVLGGLGLGLLLIVVIVIATSGGGGGNPAASATTEQTPTTTPQTPTTTPQTTTPPPTQTETVHVTLPASGTLSNGDSGPEVTSLQKALNQLGYDVGTPDGDFGSKTETAVSAFQSAHNLTPDGIVGETTAKALNDALAAKG
jgi:hypothetical protein